MKTDLYEMASDGLQTLQRDIYDVFSNDQSEQSVDQYREIVSLLEVVEKMMKELGKGNPE